MRLSALLFLAAASLSATPANLVVNGSFENNSSGTSNYNLSTSDFNGFMPGVVADNAGYGSTCEMDILISDGNYFPTTSAGNTYVGMVSDHDRINLELSSTLIAGQTYTLSFNYAVNATYSVGVGPILFYAANSSTSYNNLIHTFVHGNSGYQWYSGSFAFVADASTNYIGIGGDVTQPRMWYAIDAVELSLGGNVVVPEPSTYGLALGGLALVGAVIRRRRSK